MFTHKDIQFRSIFVINCIENRALRVSSGELLLEDTESNKTLTKLPFQKLLALFVIGNVTVTTPLIDKCKRYNVALVVMKPNLRPVFFYSLNADANFLLRKRQYEYPTDNLCISKQLVKNKILNQLKLLENTRLKNVTITAAKQLCLDSINSIDYIFNYNQLLGIEGKVAKSFFGAYYESLDWKSRCPRGKNDPINATLDIGYTILFNFIEVFSRMFGFDPYIGVYHRLWFKRKSLICDLMEPFRCLIDQQVRKAFNLKQCSKSDFALIKNEYILKHEKNGDYQKMFYTVLVERKNEIFSYMQAYYRCFMKNSDNYPQFKL